MYFKRKIDDFLQEWKADAKHKPLIIKGARQIGKTESILHFESKERRALFKNRSVPSRRANLHLGPI